MMSYIKKHKPMVVIAENVKGITMRNKGSPPVIGQVVDEDMEVLQFARILWFEQALWLMSCKVWLMCAPSSRHSKAVILGLSELQKAVVPKVLILDIERVHDAVAGKTVGTQVHIHVTCRTSFRSGFPRSQKRWKTRGMVNRQLLSYH